MSNENDPLSVCCRHLANSQNIIEEKNAEIARLRGDAEVARLRLEAAQEEPCPYVTGKTTRYCTLTPFTLTDEEREAVEDAIKLVSESLDLMNGEDSRTTAALRSLLERLRT